MQSGRCRWTRPWLGVLFGLLMSMAGASACGSSPTGPGPVVPPPPPPPPPPPAPQLGKLRYMAFGDSLTEGVINTAVIWLFQLTPGRSESYPFKLQQLMSARYTDQQPTVLNAGRAGERAAAALPRLQSVLDEAPDTEVVLLLEGINDLNQFGEDRIPATVEAMKTLMREVKRRGMMPLLATHPPLNPDGRRGDSAPLVPEYNRDLIRTAEAEGVIVVDLFGNFDLSLQGPDGLHPSEQGYARMAEIFLDAIKNAFELPAPAAILPR